MRITQVICDECGKEIKKEEPPKTTAYDTPKGRFTLSVSFSEGCGLVDVCVSCLWAMVKDAFEQFHVVSQ